jgi:hypothetical protein
VRLFTPARLFVAGLALPAAGQQQTDNSFKWSGPIAAGNWVNVHDVNGSVTVGAASGSEVQVTATKRWRRGDPATVRIEAKKIGENIVICALWGERATCDERGYHDTGNHGNRNDRNDVSVEINVLVPKGVKIRANSVNGSVTVDGATSQVDAETVNGEVDVSMTGGPAAGTTNGSVRARMGHVETDDRMAFTTVNGNVIVEFTGDFGGDVDLSTVNGSLNTNFEMTVSGRLDPKHLRAHFGKPGGPRMKLETVNGSVELRKLLAPRPAA